ncbi:MAG: DUF3667 domain-containing protein [Planctomycetota bacterium]
MGTVLREALDQTFGLEAPLFRTFADLVRGPGAVADAWLAGRRRRYLSPLKFMVIVGIVTAVAFEPLRGLRQDALAPGQALYDVGLAHHAHRYFAFFCLALLLPLAATIRLVGGSMGLRRGWLEWYALGLYCYGLAAVGQLLLAAIGVFAPSLETGRLAVEAVLPVLIYTWGRRVSCPRPTAGGGPSPGSSGSSPGSASRRRPSSSRAAEPGRE